MTQDKIKQIKEFTLGLLRVMGFSGQVEAGEKEGIIFIDIKSEESGALIGSHGENLEALQCLLRQFAAKDGYTPLILNIGEYRQRQETFLKKRALALATKVRRTKRPEVMAPMSSWERRIIHLALAEEKDITTKSVGQEPNRRIIIKPKT